MKQSYSHWSENDPYLKTHPELLYSSHATAIYFNLLQSDDIFLICLKFNVVNVIL